jgi:hypothetical protein
MPVMAGAVKISYQNNSNIKNPVHIKNQQLFCDSFCIFGSLETGNERVNTSICVASLFAYFLYFTHIRKNRFMVSSCLCVCLL